MLHIPVLIKEVIEYLNPKPNENFIDATVGQGGHAIEILNRNGPQGKVLGIDWDQKQIENAEQRLKSFGERIILVNDSYVNLKKVVEEKKFGPISGILLDLGMSSWQLEESEKGFSFLRDEPLDMRYDLNNNLTAEKIVNEWREEEIDKILMEYGEERFSYKIAKKITEARKIKKIISTFELIDVIREAIPTFAKSKSRGLSIWEKAQIGARTFQALRIAVNHELDNLTEFLPKALEMLSSHGRLVVISFHSLEDRIVKNFFKELERKEEVYPVKSAESGVLPRAEQFNRVKILTKKPVIGDSEEIKDNPRSRSAKLRAIIKK